MDYMDELIDIFQKKTNKFLAQHNYDLSSQKLIYHYTSLEKFEQIIASRKFLFTHYKNLNDTLELKHGYQIFEKLVYETKVPDADRYLKNLKAILLDHEIDFYICSFSEQNDNLSLWRLYGDDGYGVALGIDTNFTLVSEEKVENPTISAAIYKQATFEANFKNLCDRINTITNSSKYLILSELRQKEVLKLLYSHLFVYCFSICLVTKHESYQHESEVRLLLKDGRLSYPNEYKSGFYFSEDRFHLKRKSVDKTITFLDDNLTIKKETIIVEKNSILSSPLEDTFLKTIYLGPKVPKETKPNFEKLLKKYNFDTTHIKIIETDLPYQ